MGTGSFVSGAAHANHVWAWDFVFDRTSNGRSLKWLSIVDEYTRECLALEVSRSMSSANVIEVLRELVQTRGIPQHIRSDNGPEFLAGAIRSWLGSSGIETLYIEPGSPWENGYAESFQGKLRDELLDTEVFDTVLEARLLGTRWRLEYNHRRPHSSLRYMTPASFAASLAEPAVAALPPAQPARQEKLVVS